MFSVRGCAGQILATSAITVWLLFLCSCATNDARHPRLPATVTMNSGAGRGDELIITLRLADGEKLPFIVDSGSPATLFYKPLEPKLGKRLDSGTFWNFGVNQDLGVYAAPKLYLGNVLLTMAGTNVGTIDPQKLSSDQPSDAPSMGILGMDVLGNYCIQLDFAAGKMRFLNDERADKKAWGQLIPLKDFDNGCFFINDNLAGVQGSGSEIDTGCNFCGWLTPELFQQWTNQAQLSSPVKVHSPNGVLQGEAYHDLDLHATDEKSVLRNTAGTEFNGIGLGVLSQNLVTLDFPKRAMYLKRTSQDLLVDRGAEEHAVAEGKSAMKFMEHLMSANQLPGWQKHDKVASKTVHFIFQYPDSIIFDHAQKKGDPSIYHYQVSRASKASPWKLDRAWRTDADGHMIQEYTVPRADAP